MKISTKTFLLLCIFFIGHQLNAQIKITDTKIGINRANPNVAIDALGLNPDDAALLNLANSDESHQLLFFPGRLNDPNPFIQWTDGDPLRFATTQGGFTEWMRIQPDGKVGIGTPNPLHKLHVSRGSSGATANGSAIAVFERDDTGYLTILTPDDKQRGVVFGEPSNNVAGSIIYNNDINADGFQFRANGNVTRMVIDSSGDVGIGTTDPQEKLHVSGDTRIEGLLDLRSGLRNTFIGENAGVDNTTGNENVAIGQNAFLLNEVGCKNTALGRSAMVFNSDGNHNTSVGYAALLSNISGDYNTAIGGEVLFSNETGSYNTATGYFADVSSNDLTYATAIGAGAITNANEKTVIGRNIAGVVIGGFANWSTLSDGRFKESVKEDVPGLDFIHYLRPVTYNINIDKLQRHITAQMPDSVALKYFPTKEEIVRANTENRTGFIAQEVEALAKKIGYSFDGINKPQNETDSYSIAYGQFVPSLVKAIQELKVEIDAKDELIEAQNEQIESLEARLAKIEALLSGKVEPNTIKTTITDASLEQNAPNPFSEATTISYFIPENVKSASLQVLDQNGRIIKTIPIQATGKGQITLQANLLSAGTYSYSLILDGRVMETKQMVLTH